MSLLAVIQAFFAPLFVEAVTGSGFVIHPAGCVITNHHVIAGADRITVVVPGKGPFLASVVGDDDYKDLALFEIRVKDLNFLPIAESERSRCRTPICVLGYPLAPALGVEVSASQGQVNVLRDTGRIPDSPARCSRVGLTEGKTFWPAFGANASPNRVMVRARKQLSETPEIS